MNNSSWGRKSRQLSFFFFFKPQTLPHVEPNILYTEILIFTITWEVVHFIPKGKDGNLERLSHFPNAAAAISCRSWGWTQGIRCQHPSRVTPLCYCLCPEIPLCACVPRTVVSPDALVKTSIKSAVMQLTLELCNRQRKRASMLFWRCKKALLPKLEWFPSTYFIRNIKILSISK